MGIGKTRGELITAGLLADQAGIVHGPLPRERALLAQRFRPGKLLWGGPVIPPGQWISEHARAQQTSLFEPQSRVVRAHNAPVPRQASCHYVNEELTRSVSSTYFY